MLHFLKEHMLLLQQLVLFALQNAPLGNVLDTKQYGGAGASFVEHLAGVQEHRACAEVGEFMPRG